MIKKANGFIHLILGSMKSGKSSALYEQIDRAQYRKKKVCLLRPKADTREFVSRVKNLKVDTYSCDSINELYDTVNIDRYDIICIDEGQFIDGLGLDCNTLANNGKEVYIAALNGDSDLKPWKNISELLPFCDQIIRLSAICNDCGSSYDATFSYFDGVKNGQIVIGDNQYLALCRSCISKRKS
jgi:thymidine kinase